MLELNKKYKIILADPPWKYEFSRSHSRAINDYKTLERKEICDFKIKDIADDNSVLLIWITFPKLDWAFDVIESWGFKYKTVAFVWIKTNPKTGGVFKGIGRWVQGNAELVLLATKGKPKRISKSISQIIMAKRANHSKKPDIVRDKIIELMGDLPRIELFARYKAKGWDAWGNEELRETYIQDKII